MALFGRKKPADPVIPDAAAPVVDDAPPADAGPVRRSLAEQRDRLMGLVEPLRPFGMQIWDVEGLTLCEDIRSDVDLPLVTTSTVAGWGVRASDLVGATAARPATVHVVDQIGERQAPGAALAPGMAVEVVAGAMVPDGVDAVVPRELGQTSGHDVLFTAEARHHQNLLLAGSELADGDELVAAGEVLGPRAIAAMAEGGYDKVLVRPRPRVVVLSVGSDLVTPGQPLTDPFQRYDAATALLAASARADGATVYPLGAVSPERAVLRQTVSDQLLRADLIVCSAGPEVAEVFDGLGEVDTAEVMLNAGGPMTCVLVGDERVPLLVVPRGPVGAFVAYHAFVRPLLGRLGDTAAPELPVVRGRVPEELESEEGVTEHRPAFRSADGTVRPVGRRGTELAHDLARANVLLVIPEHWGGVAPGSEVDCLVLDAGVR